MNNELQVIIKESGLEKTKANILLNNFKDYFDIASEWEIKSKEIVIKDESQTAEMEMARIGRLFLREKRIAIEKSRKELKEQSLREGKAIDGISNVLKALIIPIEEYLDKQEHFVEIREKAKAEVLRIEEEERIEKERLENERLEKIEQERIRLENEKLKKEALKKEEARLKREQEIKIKLAKADEKRQAEKEKERIAIESIKNKAKKEKEEAENRRQAEIQKAEKEKQLIIKEQEALKEQLASMIECPKCHHKFNLK